MLRSVKCTRWLLLLLLVFVPLATSELLLSFLLSPSFSLPLSLFVFTSHEVLVVVLVVVAAVLSTTSGQVSR
jgi:hypothetical protein